MPLSICLCGSKKIPLSLCQYPNLKKCFTIHAYIMVSKIAPYSMLLFAYLKMPPVLGSPKLPFYIYATIRFFKDAPLDMPIFVSLTHTHLY
jgi:hypothetical protein